MKSLEDRLTPSTTINVGPTTAELIAAIRAANNDVQGPAVLVLPANTVYTLTAPANSQVTNEDNNWYGPNGLPAIDHDVTIEGNGSTIQRSTASGTPNFRLFYVSGGMDNQLPLGRLTLINLTLSGGVAKGGDGSQGGGGGMGAGGAIFNQGTLILNGVTVSNNQALGGIPGRGFTGGGGGMGSDAPGYDSGYFGGGGFGGNFPGGRGNFLHYFGGQGGYGQGGGGGFVFSSAGEGQPLNNNVPPPYGPYGAGGAGGGLGGFGGMGGFGSPYVAAAGGDGGGGGSAIAGPETQGGGSFGNGGIGGPLGEAAGGGGGVGGGGGGGFYGGNGYGSSGGGGGFGGGGGAYGGNGGFGGGGGQGGGNGGFGGGDAGGEFAAGGGGAAMGGAIFNMGASTVPGSGVLTIINCTLTANTAQGGYSYLESNGGDAYGGAVFNLDGSVTINNSTLAFNSVLGGAGGHFGENGLANGGAVYNLAYGNLIQTGGANTASLTLNNSILSNTIGGADLGSNGVSGNNSNLAVIAGPTSNLIQTMNIINTASNFNGVTVTADPMLGPLGSNGGPTETMALRRGSPAIKTGTHIPGITTDQRGFPLDSPPDIGAFQTQRQTTPAPAIAFAVGAGVGGAPFVNVYDAAGTLVRTIQAYQFSFRGGVHVATADINGDNIADLITAPGFGGGPVVRIWDGETGTLESEFNAYDPIFRGGVNLAVVRLFDTLGSPQIITGAGPSGGPHVKVFDSQTQMVLASFFAFDPRFTGGISVTATAATAGGPGHIITGAGPGGGPHVRVFSATGAPQGLGFMAYDLAFRGGVSVAALRNGDIVTAPASSGGPVVREFSQSGSMNQQFLAYDATFLGGVSLGVIPFGPESGSAILTGAGSSGGPHVKQFDAGDLSTPLHSFMAFDPAFTGGVFVG